MRMENQTRHYAHLSENVTRTGSIFASLKKMHDISNTGKLVKVG